MKPPAWWRIVTVTDWRSLTGPNHHPLGTGQTLLRRQVMISTACLIAATASGATLASSSVVTNST